MAKTKNDNLETTTSTIDKVDKIPVKGEIFLRERIDEETKEKKYSVAITMDNPFVDLFEGGLGNEYNHKLNLGFKENKGKIKAQFNYKAKEMLKDKDVEKIPFTGYIQRRKFYDQSRFKSVRYIGIFISSPFDDSEVALTIPRADALGLVEMFANERLVKV